MKSRSKRSLALMRAGGIATVVAFAMSGGVAASASAALPEFWQHGEPLSHSDEFTAVGGAAELVTGVGTLTCTSSDTTGEIANSREIAGMVTVYRGCAITVVVKLDCHTQGAQEGEIITSPVRGSLGEIDQGSGVGLHLSRTGESYTELPIDCRNNDLTIKGSVIGEITGVNTTGTTNSLVFAGAGLTQDPERITEEGTEHSEIKLESRLGGNESVFEGMSLRSVDKITFAKEVEVKA